MPYIEARPAADDHISNFFPGNGFRYQCRHPHGLI
jgi:hypothetical protein